MNLRRLVVVFLFVSVAHGQSERSLVSDGNKMYDQTKFSDAEVNYRKALEKNKESKQSVFNLGDALYKQGRFGEAAEQYASSASKTNDPDLRSKAYYNMGNALLKSQKIPESIGAYEQALKINPKDFDTKYNLEFAKALLQQQQQQKKEQNKQDKNQQQKDQKQQQKNKQDQQDKQKQDQQQNQSQQNQDQQQKAQQDQLQNPKKGQISKQDAERILEALKNEEKDVQKKLHKKVPARVTIEKDW